MYVHILFVRNACKQHACPLYRMAYHIVHLLVLRPDPHNLVRYTSARCLTHIVLH